MKKNLLFLFSIVLLISVWSCRQFSDFDEINKVTYQGEYAIPLVNTQLSMRDVLKSFEENSTVMIDPNGLIHLNYRGDVISQSSDDIFESINAQLPPLIPITSNPTPLSFSTADGLQIDQIIFKEGKLFFQFQSRETEPMLVTIRIPQIQKDGEPLTITTTINGHSGSGPFPIANNTPDPLLLNDYVLTTENQLIHVEYEALKANGEPGNLTDFIIAFRDLAFFYAEGYLGTMIFAGGRDTINIDFFDEWIQGDVYFEEPRITYFLENAFGLPTRSVINVLEVLTVDGNAFQLESDVIGVGEGINFAYPELNEIGQVKTTTFTFDKSNSNITDLLGAGPIAIDYEVDALTNPDSNLAIRGFITDSSFYKVSMEIDLPLYGNAANFIARDTIDIDFTNWQDVDAAEFKLVAENQLPLDVIVQGYFLSPNGVILDSLLAGPQRLITGAPVDSNGDAISLVEEITYAPFSNGRFSGIKPSNRIIVVAEFASTNNGDIPVRIYSDQEVKIKVGAKLTISN